MSDFAKHVNTSMKDAQELWGSARYFTTNQGFKKIRDDQQSGVPTKDGDNLERLIKRAPKWAGGETRRGVTVSSALFKAYTTVGAVVDANYHSTASWSTNQHTPDSFAGNTAGHSIVFIVKGNSHPAGTSIKNLSHYNGEDEVLVSKDVKYRVRAVTKGKGPNNHRTYVEVEPVY